MDSNQAATSKLHSSSLLCACAQAGDRVAALTAAVDELSSLEHYVRTTKPTRQHATMLTVSPCCLLRLTTVVMDATHLIRRPMQLRGRDSRHGRKFPGSRSSRHAP